MFLAPTMWMQFVMADAALAETEKSTPSAEIATSQDVPESGEQAAEVGEIVESPAQGAQGGGWFSREWTAWLRPTTTVIFAVGLVVLTVIAWGLNLIALPGNWISVALLALYAWLGPEHGRAGIGYGVVIAASICALLGEILEFAAGAVGAKKAGASRRSTIFAMIGSMIGALAGAAIGIPVPVIGSVLAALLFAGVGATAGAMYGEWTDGRSWKESWSIGQAAFWGRTFGTLGKVTAGLAIVAITLGGVLL